MSVTAITGELGQASSEGRNGVGSDLGDMQLVDECHDLLGKIVSHCCPHDYRVAQLFDMYCDAEDDLDQRQILANDLFKEFGKVVEP